MICVAGNGSAGCDTGMDPSCAERGKKLYVDTDRDLLRSHEVQTIGVDAEPRVKYTSPGYGNAIFRFRMERGKLFCGLLSEAAMLPGVYSAGETTG